MSRHQMQNPLTRPIQQANSANTSPATAKYRRVNLHMSSRSQSKGTRGVSAASSNQGENHQGDMTTFSLGCKCHILKPSSQRLTPPAAAKFLPVLKDKLQMVSTTATIEPVSTVQHAGALNQASQPSLKKQAHKSHSTIIADTAMINHRTPTVVNGLISQLNSTSVASGDVSVHSQGMVQQSVSHRSLLGQSKSTTSYPVGVASSGSKTGGSLIKFKQMTQIKNRQLAVGDITDSAGPGRSEKGELEQESRPICSDDSLHQCSNATDRGDHTSSLIMLPEQKVRAAQGEQWQQHLRSTPVVLGEKVKHALRQQQVQSRHEIKIQNQDQRDFITENYEASKDDFEGADDDLDEVGEMSDRFLLDSAQSRPGGVNVPLNSLPKLQRHRKSDLAAYELEGNPQKPSGTTVHFSKRRTNGFPNQAPALLQGKVEDSGATEGKVLMASIAIAPPELSIQEEHRSSNVTATDEAHLKSSSISEGSIMVTQRLNKETVTFNRNSLLDRRPFDQATPKWAIKSYRPDLKQSSVRPYNGSIVHAAKADMGRAGHSRPQSTDSFELRGVAGGSSHRKPFIVGSIEDRIIRDEPTDRGRTGDALCLEDLETSTVPHQVETPSITNLDDGQIVMQEQQRIFADENVGDVTPHKESKANLTVSENLSQSQYLSNSFQNTKRSSQLKQILTMSLTNSVGASSLGPTKRYQKPAFDGSKKYAALVSSTVQKKEKVNYRIQVRPQRVTSNAAAQQLAKSANQVSSKLQAKRPSERGQVEKSQSKLTNKRAQPISNNVRGGVAKNTRLKKADTESIKSGTFEPLQLIKAHKSSDIANQLSPTAQSTASLAQEVQQHGAQKVKPSPLVKRATFGGRREVAASGSQQSRSGLGTCQGSFIRDEEMPNNYTNDNRTKVATASRANEGSNGTPLKGAISNEGDIALSIDIGDLQLHERSRVDTLMATSIDPTPQARHEDSKHIGHSALQRGMSPPANGKNVSTGESRESRVENINLTLATSEGDQRTLNSLKDNRHWQQTKYNRQAYKLKQYISDVNKINQQQRLMQQSHGANIKMTSGQSSNQNQLRKPNSAQIKQHPGKVRKPAPVGTEKRLFDSQASSIVMKKKSANSVVSMTSTRNQAALVKSQRANHRMGTNQKSVSPRQEASMASQHQSSSLSRVLSYCPASSQRQSLQQPGGQVQRPGSRQGPGHRHPHNLRSSQIIAITESKRRAATQSLSLPRVFGALLSYLDFMSLFTLMQTRKDYRWDITTGRGKGYQPDYYWVHKVIRKRMKQILLKDGGLRSTVERRNFWIYRSKLTRVKDSYPVGHYQDLLDDHFKEASCERPSLTEIGKDIGRTFPDLMFFQKDQPGQQKLHRLLTAASVFQQEQSTQADSEPLGYTQGMNFIAGTALVHLQQHEENTFWFMISLLCEHKFRHVFNFLSEGTFRVLCFQLEVLTQVFLPDLHDHLSCLRIPTDIYASNWFITMFTNDLPFDMAPSVLDVYLLEGHKGLLRIALSILTFLKSELLTLPYDELMVFLSHPNAREQIFRGLDQYWLFQTSFKFKITSGLLNELHRLFCVREKLTSLKDILKKDSKVAARDDSMDHRSNPLLSSMHDGELITLANYNSMAVVPTQSKSAADQVREYSGFVHFTKLRLRLDETNVLLKKRHEWHVLMLGPDDVESLLEQGLETDDIEKLRVFYNSRIKDRSLGTVLKSIEAAIQAFEDGEKKHDVLTPRQGSASLETNQDIAQENYLRATKKMTVNQAQTAEKAIGSRREGMQSLMPARDLPQKPFSKASSLSPEMTMRSAMPTPTIQTQAIQVGQLFTDTDQHPSHQRKGNHQTLNLMSGKKLQANDLSAKKPDSSDVPEVTEDILSNLISPKSSSLGPRQINQNVMRGSMASTPKIKQGGALALQRPVRQRNFIEDPTFQQKHNSQHLPYGITSHVLPQQTASQQTTSIFGNWPLDLGSKLESLFKPLSLSPTHAKVQASAYPSQSLSLYDSTKVGAMKGNYSTSQDQVKPSPLIGRDFDNQTPCDLSNSGGSRQSVANVYGDDYLDKQSPEAQLSALKAVKGGVAMKAGGSKERKTMTPHMMLNGDDQIQVNASSSFDFGDTERSSLNIPQNNTSIFSSHMTKMAQLSETMQIYQASSVHRHPDSREAYHAHQRPSHKHSKPPRSSSHHTAPLSQADYQSANLRSQSSSGGVNPAFDEQNRSQDFQLMAARGGTAAPTRQPNLPEPLDLTHDSQDYSRKEPSLLRKVLSPPSQGSSTLFQKNRIQGQKARASGIRVAGPGAPPQKPIQIHKVPQSIVERKSIDNLNTILKQHSGTHPQHRGSGDTDAQSWSTLNH